MKRLQAMSQNATAQLEMYTKSFAVDKDKAEQILAQYQANLTRGLRRKITRQRRAWML